MQDSTEFDINPGVEEIEEQSLLEENASEGLDTTSIFGTETEAADEVVENDYNAEIEKKKEEQRLIEEHNRRIRQSPEFKAQIVYNQYLKSNPYLSGQEKRRLRKECLKNAKKGRYDYMFDEEKIKRREERQKEKFDKLNKPKVHTVNDLSEETKETLKEMADASVVPTFNKETGSFVKPAIL